MSKRIQNEIINLLGEAVRRKILEDVKKAKYYSILLDCPPDKSHQEQLSLTIRYVKLLDDRIEVSESFIDFLIAGETTGSYLSKLVVAELERHGLSIDDMQGQGYDNGANMAGIKSSVQARLTTLNPLAFFTPCGCHSLNLVLCDMVKNCRQAMSFFGIIQQMFFSHHLLSDGIFSKNMLEMVLV